MVKWLYPENLKEALQMLNDYPGCIRFGGGTDIMVRGLPEEGTVLSLHGVPECRGIHVEHGECILGAACTYQELLDHAAIPAIWKEILEDIAAPGIRNKGTVGGNICNASPAGDTLPFLYLWDARLELARWEMGRVEIREVPIEAFIQGVRKTDLHPNELLTRIFLPDTYPLTYWMYEKIRGRQAQAIAKLSFVGMLRIEEGRIRDFRVAYGAAGPTIIRQRELEKAFFPCSIAEWKTKIPAILAAYGAALHPIDDQRSTAEYRKKTALALLGELVQKPLEAASLRTLIRSASIMDGSGKPAYRGSVLVEGERIGQIFKEGELVQGPFDRIIDGEGLVLSPGFIDTHSHSDLKVLTEPEVLPKLMQGITTEVLGQDGISMAPLPAEFITPWRKNIAGLDGVSDGIDWDYQTTARYLEMIEKAAPAVNESYLLPHGNIRMEAMGLEDRAPTPLELEKMREITRRDMETGCLGVSSGLIYMPCAYSHTEELIEICKVVKEFDGIFVVHQRSEADTILPSMEEILRIGRESGVRIHFSHFKVCGKENWKFLPDMFSLLDRGKEEGLTISLDQYPYVAGSTMLGVILPPWAHDGGTDRLVERLQDPLLREKMKTDIQNGIPGWDNFVAFAGTEGIFITSVASEKNQDVIGLSLDQLGEKWGKNPLDATFDLLLEEKNGVGMVDFYGLEDHVRQILKRPEMNACTDGLLAGMPHPRVYGAFPRILGKYAREEAVLSFEEAIHKMTGKAAEAFALKDRGFVREGYFGDLVLWDPQTVEDRGTFSDPRQYPAGIEWVLVNGTIAVEKGKFTGERKGKVLRKTREEKDVHIPD